jgi:hypothetical protein
MDKWQMVDNLTQYMLINQSNFRCGQALFNALCILDPKTANMIRGTNDDCFYQDKKIPLFQNKVLEIWGE